MHDHNDNGTPNGSNLAATLMLDSVARSRSRHLSRAALASGPLMFEVDAADVARAAAGRQAGEAAAAGLASPAPVAEAAARRTVDWARQLAASAARLRNEVRGR